MSVLTRIKNNQITDGTIWANSKIVAGSIVGSLFNPNIVVTSDFVITGNLYVTGSSTSLTVASTNTYVNDPLLVLNNAYAAGAMYDIGFVFERGTDVNQAFYWDETSDEFKLIATTEAGTTFGNIGTETSYSKLHLGNLVAQYDVSTSTLTASNEITGLSLNVTGNVLATNLTGTLTTAAQPNITSVGTLISLEVTNAITGASLNVTGNVSATEVNTGTVKATGLINTTGNISGSVVNSATLGVTGTATIATVSAGAINATGLINTTGNISGAVVNSATLGVTGTATIATVSAEAINATGLINTTGNISGSVVNSGTLNVSGVTTLTGFLNTSANISASIVNAGAINITGAIDSTATTQSTNTTTGAIVTAGGVGIAKNLNVGGDVVITGNLTVEGVTTTINSTTLTVDDLNVVLASGAVSSAAADGAGISVDGASATMLYTHATTSWNFNKLIIGTGLNVTGNVSAADIIGASLNVTGNVTATEVNTGTIKATGLINTTGNISGAVINSGALNVSGVTTLTGFLNSSANISAPIVNAGAINSTGLINTTGNVTATEVNTGTVKATGLINTTGNISGAVVNSATLGVTGTATIATVSAEAINATGLINTTGNVSASIINADTLAATGTVWANSATDTSSLTTGALIVNGGTAVGKTMWVGEGMVINSTQSAEAFHFKGQGANNSLIYADPVKNSVVIGGANVTIQDGTAAKFGGTGAIVVPVGTSSQRPAAAGNVDVAGMLRFSTTSNMLEFYDGSAWTSAGSEFTVISTNSFSGNGVQLAFTMSASSTTAGTLVMINGVVQIPVTAYSVSGTTLTFTEAPATGDTVDARTIVTTATVSSVASGNGYNTFDVATVPYANITAGTASPTVRMSIDAVTGTATFTNDVVINGQLTVNGDTAGNINIGDQATDKVQLQGTIVYNQTALSAPGANLKQLDSFATAAYHTSKYLVQVRDASQITSAEIMLAQDGTNVSVTTYAILNTHPSGMLGTFSANVVGADVKLWYTPAAHNLNANIKVQTTYVV